MSSDTESVGSCSSHGSMPRLHPGSESEGEIKRPPQSESDSSSDEEECDADYFRGLLRDLATADLYRVQTLHAEWQAGNLTDELAIRQFYEIIGVPVPEGIATTCQKLAESCSGTPGSEGASKESEVGNNPEAQSRGANQCTELIAEGESLLARIPNNDDDKDELIDAMRQWKNKVKPLVGP